MIEFPSDADVVEQVWSLASDARWHSPEELAWRLYLRPWQVKVVLDFLAKYGFLEWKAGFVRKNRISAVVPSPGELRRILAFVARQLLSSPQNS